LDNIAHTLAGFALVRTGLGRRTRFAGAALILGSNLPDADLLALAGGRLAFIDAHRGTSHSLLGGCALGALLGVGLWALGRLRPGEGPGASRGEGSPSGDSGGAGLGRLCGLALLAVLLHLGFDALNDYGIRPLLPFVNRWWYGDTIFIVDPWFWLLLGGGAHLATRRSRWEPLLWAGWAILAIPVLFEPSPPMPAKALWLLGLGILALLRWRTPSPSPAWPRAAFAVLALYVLAMAGLHQKALEIARDLVRTREPGPVSRLAVIPRPADPLHWNMLYETPAQIVTGTVAVRPAPAGAANAANASGGGAAAVGTGAGTGTEHRYEKHLDDPRTRRALATPEGGVARRFCRYLFADIEEEPGGAADVSFRDARFVVRGRREFSVLTVRVEP